MGRRMERADWFRLCHKPPSPSTPKTGWRLFHRPHEEAGREKVVVHGRQQLFTSFVVLDKSLLFHLENERICLKSLLTLSVIFIFQVKSSLRPEQELELAWCYPWRKAFLRKMLKPDLLQHFIVFPFCPRPRATTVKNAQDPDPGLWAL